MKRITRRHFAAGAASIVACGPAKTQTAAVVIEAPRPSAPPPAVAAPDLAFDPLLAPNDLRKIVWSWTTTAQADELLRDRVLFTRSESPSLGVGHLFRLLGDHRADALPRLVLEKLPKGRFGWFNPFAAAAGVGGENYGHELLRIELKPEAWLVRMQATKAAALQVVDLHGAFVERSAVLATPERLAGVLFYNDVSRRVGCMGTSGDSPKLPYREVYLGNADMVTWSLRTPAIRNECTRIAEQLTALAREDHRITDLCGWATDLVTHRWLESPTTMRERYEASLAFTTLEYMPTADQLRTIARKLTVELA